MKGKYGGPMSTDDLFQALWQDRNFFTRHCITHVRATFLYFTPCDGDGHHVIISDETGKPIDGYVTAGGYRAAAEAYETGLLLEPRAMTRGTVF